MTLEQAAEKQYLLFCSMTSNSTMPWADIPDIIKDAWKEVVRTCPRKNRATSKAIAVEKKVAGLLEDYLIARKLS